MFVGLHRCRQFLCTSTYCDSGGKNWITSSSGSQKSILMNFSSCQVGKRFLSETLTCSHVMPLSSVSSVAMTVSFMPLKGIRYKRPVINCTHSYCSGNRSIGHSHVRNSTVQPSRRSPCPKKCQRRPSQTPEVRAQIFGSSGSGPSRFLPGVLIMHRIITPSGGVTSGYTFQSFGSYSSKTSISCS